MAEPAWGTPPERGPSIMSRIQSPTFGHAADTTPQREALARLLVEAMADPARQLDAELRVLMRRYMELAEDRIGWLSEANSPTD